MNFGFKFFLEHWHRVMSTRFKIIFLAALAGHTLSSFGLHLRWEKGRLRRIVLVVCTSVTATLIVAGCGGAPERDSAPSKPVDVSAVPDAVPKIESKSRYGNPKSYVVFGKRYYTLKRSKGFVERGVASWYGEKFHGRRTSSGETYNMYAMTAAHKTLPLPTYVRVTNLENKRSIVVRVNDRGPFQANRVLDLSYTGATKLGMLRRGTALVEVRAIDPTYAETVPVSVAVESADDDANIELFLQIGAFGFRDNAEKLKSKVGQIADEIVQIEEIIHNGKTIFRVKLGPLLDVAHADRLAFLLSDSGFEHPHIVLE